MPDGTAGAPLRARMHAASPGGRDDAVAQLVLAARAGDSLAWARLVRRFEPMLRQIARSYRLAPADVDDAMQETWTGLLSGIGRLREPAAVAGWLVTAMRRQCLRALQAPVREIAIDPAGFGDRSDDTPGPEAQLLAAERRELLAAGLAALPARHRELMVLLATEPAPSYDEAAASLGMPHGSIGPIRGRSLARLARNPALRALAADD